MKKTFFKGLSVFLSVLMILSVVSVAGIFGFAQNEPQYDYGFNVSKGEEISSLGTDYAAYKFKPSSQIGALSGPFNPTAIDPDSDGGDDPYFTTKLYGSYGGGYLKPTAIPSGGYTALTLTKEDYSDFYAEYEVLGSWSHFGIAFGAEKGKFPFVLDNNADNDTGAIVYFEVEGVCTVAGTINKSTISVGNSSSSVGTHGSFNGVDNVRVTGVTNKKIDPTKENETFTVCLEVTDNILKVWEKDAKEKGISVALTGNYKGGYVSLFANQTQHGAFKAFHIKGLSKNASNSYQLTSDFNGLSSTEKLNAQYDAYTYIPSNDETASADVLNAWTVADSLEGYEEVYKNTYLKPNHKVNEPIKYSLLTLEGKTFVNLSAEVCFVTTANEYGITVSPKLGQIGTASNGGIKLFVTSGGEIKVEGAIDAAAADFTGGTVNTSANSVTSSAIEGYVSPSATDAQKNKTVYTLNVRIFENTLTVSLKEFPTSVLTVPLTSEYEGGFYSLYSNGYEQGGFVSSTVKVAKKEQAVVGDKVEYDFGSVGVAELNSDFAAVEGSADSTPVVGEPTTYWTKSNEVPDPGFWRNNYLKPNRRTNNSVYSLLSYDNFKFKNVEVTTEYITTHGRFGIVLAPLGELPTSSKAVYVYVEGGGYVNVRGAVDAASANCTDGYVKVADKNVVVTESLKGYSAPVDYWSDVNSKAYTLRVRAVDGLLTVFVDEYPDFSVSVKLTEDFDGSTVSLYSTGFDQGAFKKLKIEELQSAGIITDEKTFYQSFNTISSLDALKDNFETYYLDDVANTPVAASLSDHFRLYAGRLKSNKPNQGTDLSGFSILTYKNKRYENFEISLKYEQDWVRYGVMFGTELGEFAFKKDGEIYSGNGGVFMYSEAEGHRNARGSLYASYYDNAAESLARKTTGGTVASYMQNGDVGTAVAVQKLHEMRIRVVNGYVTMILDNDESTRIVLRLDDYDGGYISLVTNSSRGRNTGAFNSISITELDENAELGTQKPEIPEGYDSINEVAKDFDAYYVEDATISTKPEKVDIKKHWWLNNEGYVARKNSASGISEVKNVELLTYKKGEFTDFELTYTYQQTYQRTGIIFGADKDVYTLSQKSNGEIVANKGTMLYIEAEGTPNMKGTLAGYTNAPDKLYRIVTPAPDGYRINGDAAPNVNAKKEHTVKLVVKDKKAYVFIDGSETCYLYVDLGDDYKGGYISIFSTASNKYGIDNFKVSETITTELPKPSGVKVNGNTVSADFDNSNFDDSLFTTYYMDKINKEGSLEKKNFSSQWVAANGTLTRNPVISTGGDDKKISVLTYNKKLTDFSVTYDYQKSDNRLMFMFGTDKGKYALKNTGGPDMPNGGVILYPENNLGHNGGFVSLAGTTPLTQGWRPITVTKVPVKDYHENDDWTNNMGTWHTITITVINKHCYVFLDDYGLIAEYRLTDDYDGGYVSLAAAGSKHSFDNLKITDLSASSGNTVIKAENPRDVYAALGTAENNVGLPSKVSVTLKNGKKADLSVEWKSLNYDANTKGTYKFFGVLRPNASYSNPAQVVSVANVRLGTEKSDELYWSFDTSDDLRDFETYYIENKNTAPVKNDPLKTWFADRDGTLRRDIFRSNNGSMMDRIEILTYAKRTFKNFELEVDYTQHYTRMMVMFGSEKPGEYINLNDFHNISNPAMAYVEYEGNRNFSGNIVNTNFYNRTDENIYNAREEFPLVPDYYTKEKAESYNGNKHHMKLRVVGQKASLWVDGIETPFTITLADYDGGYISLVSCTKEGAFDNLKITPLGEVSETVKDKKVDANGKLSLTLGDGSSALPELSDITVPEEDKPTDNSQKVDKVEEKTDILPIVLVSLGGAVLLLLIIIIIYIALKNKKQRNK